MTENPRPIRIVDLNPIVRRTVVSGTPDQPLVVDQQRRDGTVIRVRIVNPERSFQIPTYVFWDRTVTPAQQAIIRQTMADLFAAVRLDPTQLDYFGDWHEADYRDARGALVPYKSIEWQISSKLMSRRGQLDADQFAYDMYGDPYQKSHPHQEVVFTNQDMRSRDTNFVIGVAVPDLGTLISLWRLSSITDPDLRTECIRTEIFHEVGHVLGLPSARRGVERLEKSLGSHCRSEGCSMKQGLNVPHDWINFTRQRLVRGGRPFCSECVTDLAVKYRRTR